ncbi:MAG TPA: threonine synthase [Xanthomonadaceae bacterium]|nr:threonine synthase [Xanthomonadaceae bacterium]
MKFISTRGKAPAVGLSEALAAGLAPDGGLYVPERLPCWSTSRVPEIPSPQPFDRLRTGRAARALGPSALAVPDSGLWTGREARSLSEFDGLGTLPEIAASLLAPFFDGDVLASELPAICREALDIEAPLVPLRGEGDHLLELFHGPSAAFKDFAARFLASSLARIRADADDDLTILVATSGDTGGAVAAAFHRRPGFRVVVLYPDGRVSPRQARHLGSFGDNVRTFRVAGSFDDCQAMVKALLADADLRARVPLTSANSISLGRLLPQISYYAFAALRFHREHGEALGFVIPTGNLGNALACVLARDMGLPIGRIVLACNANRPLPEFFAGADYMPRASVATLANAMDVGAPSNFERLRFWHADDTALRALLTADSVEDADIGAAIQRAPTRHGIVPCPHTAAGLVVLERLRAAGETAPLAVVATAHPAKFDEVVEPRVGLRVEVPATLAAALSRPECSAPLAADAAELRNLLK